MVVKITVTILLATALTFSKAHAHSGYASKVPVNGYVYFMMGVGIVYFGYLMVRMQRKRNKSIKPSNNKN